MPNWEIRQGDALEVLRTLPDASAQCCVTSPPYWGLRDYGCAGQLGLERTPEEYVGRMVEVFREVRRVLRDDGTLWLNIGDSYASGGRKERDPGQSKMHPAFEGERFADGLRPDTPNGLKPKDLVGIPWRLAFALQQPREVVAVKDRADRAWLAALIDGEGCITTTVAQPTTGINESYAIVLQVRMTDRECLDRIVELTGMSHVQAENLSPSMEGQRPASCWKVAGENAATLLAEIYPFLCIKRRQALVAWNLQRLKDGITTKRGVSIPPENMELRRELHRVVRALNQRERVDIPEWCREPTYTIEPGWYLRSDVIWAKPNPMPESVTDRPTKAHEYVFLLAKAERYYYDSEASAEPASGRDPGNKTHRGPEAIAGHTTRSGLVAIGAKATRNRRSVWTVSTQACPEAHFAVMPESLVEPCILAGCPEGGTVLDPFAGAGTTGVVALRHRRRFLGVELNPAYVEMATRRITEATMQTSLLSVATETPEQEPEQGSLLEGAHA